MLTVCTLIQDEILHEFWLQKFLPWNLLEFIGQYWDARVSRK